MFRLIVTAGLALIPVLSYGNDMALSVKASTLGIVVDTTRYVSDRVNYRIWFSQSVNALNDGGRGLAEGGSGGGGGFYTYSYDYRWQTLGALLDWHPMESRFRFSAGLLLNNNNTDIKVDARCEAYGQSIPCEYRIGNNIYPAAQVSQPQGELSYRHLAPYLGIGWGNALAKDKKWTFASDLGLVYQGKTSVTLVATGSAPGLQDDLAAENASIRSDSPLWWPVVSFGIGYHW